MIQGRPASDEDEYLNEWSLNSLKENLTLINDILRQLMTISAAILGVSIFYEKIITNNSFKIAAISTFFVALILSFFGIIPYGSKIITNDPVAFKEQKKSIFKTKYWLAIAACFFLTAGFAIVIVHLIDRF
ncbi:hypothetical protein DNI29_19400 [Hymenobacter sediminis]|uniref:hypothetical protein n=1 Tax=Hymenobacter sediminis TaxID=2218621 RepID=UPI000DA64386|nr:hypothetical protein [Hymenobacter sediminis]RPD44870.1 hypothetical protein DNI29_19400 [Hymenobacter sediminis]